MNSSPRLPCTRMCRSTRRSTIYALYFPPEQHSAIHKALAWFFSFFFLQHSSCHASFCGKLISKVIWVCRYEAPSQKQCNCSYMKRCVCMLARTCECVRARIFTSWQLTPPLFGKMQMCVIKSNHCCLPAYIVHQGCNLFVHYQLWLCLFLTLNAGAHLTQRQRCFGVVKPVRKAGVLCLESESECWVDFFSVLHHFKVENQVGNVLFLHYWCDTVCNPHEAATEKSKCSKPNQWLFCVSNTCWAEDNGCLCLAAKTTKNWPLALSGEDQHWLEIFHEIMSS